MNFGKLGAVFSRLGARSGSGTRPTAPVLAMDPAWTTADATPDFTIDVDDTVAAGDSVTLQIQATGGDWSSLVVNSTHAITGGEDTANQVDLSTGSLSNAVYDARASVTHGGRTSSWSNTVSFTISASTTAGQPIGLLLSLTKAA